jgi:hypothetical protein
VENFTRNSFFFRGNFFGKTISERKNGIQFPIQFPLCPNILFFQVHFPMLFRAHSSAGPWVKSSAEPDEEFLSDVPKEPKKESQKKGKLIKIGNDLEDDEEIKKIKDPEKRAKKLAQKISESSAMHGIPSHAVYIVQFDDDDEYGWRRRRRGFFGDDNDDKKVEFHLPKGQKLVYVSSALETSAVLRENA